MKEKIKQGQRDDLSVRSTGGKYRRIGVMLAGNAVMNFMLIDP